MIDGLPSYISPFFIATTIGAASILLYAIGRASTTYSPFLLSAALLFSWLALQGILAATGFFNVTTSTPPRVFAFGAMPGIVAAVAAASFLPAAFLFRLSLEKLTLLHVVRIPVEIVLLWLFQNGQVPAAMTFEGSNLDILSGLSAPLALLVFKRAGFGRQLLIIWNLAALGLLFNIVVTAILAFPSPIQSIAFEQPNRAVMYFPFVWLPAFIVPIVFFCHLAALRKLLSNYRPEPAV